MKLHLQTGSASFVQTMHQRGLCVSYDHLRTFSTDIANSVINHWEQIGVVVPPQAVKGVFTTGGFDGSPCLNLLCLCNSCQVPVLHMRCFKGTQQYSRDL